MFALYSEIRETGVALLGVARLTLSAVPAVATERGFGGRPSAASRNRRACRLSRTPCTGGRASGRRVGQTVLRSAAGRGSSPWVWIHWTRDEDCMQRAPQPGSTFGKESGKRLLDLHRTKATAGRSTGPLLPITLPAVRRRFAGPPNTATSPCSSMKASWAARRHNAGPTLELRSRSSRGCLMNRKHRSPACLPGDS